MVFLEESGFGSRHAAPMVARVFDAIASDNIVRAPTQNEVDTFYDVDQITDLDVPETAAEASQ